jgi:hypothetical protein
LPALAIVGGFYAFLGDRKKDREAEAQKLAALRDRYDAAILTRCMDSYERLWEALEPTSLGNTRPPLEAQVLQEALTRWYFMHGGGLYLSRETSVQFIRFRDQLPQLDYQEIRRRASTASRAELACRAPLPAA